MAKAGFERDYGRRVLSDLDQAGLTELRGEGRARLIDSTSLVFDFFRLTFESLRGAIVDAGLLTAEEADAASARFNENVRLLTPMMMAGIGAAAEIDNEIRCGDAIARR